LVRSQAAGRPPRGADRLFTDRSQRRKSLSQGGSQHSAGGPGNLWARQLRQTEPTLLGATAVQRSHSLEVRSLDRNVRFHAVQLLLPEHHVLRNFAVSRRSGELDPVSRWYLGRDRPIRHLEELV